MSKSTRVVNAGSVYRCTASTEKKSLVSITTRPAGYAPSFDPPAPHCNCPAANAGKNACRAPRNKSRRSVGPVTVIATDMRINAQLQSRVGSKRNEKLRNR
eukprot:3750811-Rhodomonas_salina.1